jgi:hypothetical protein
MLKRYRFLLFFAVIFLGLSGWARHVLTAVPIQSIQSKQTLSAEETERRRGLIEVLDRLVAYEHYYRAVYGHFTKLLGRVGYTIPKEIAELYEIRVEEATASRLVLTAVSEIHGRAGDFVAIDHQYRVQANFPIPEPRADFLKVQAMRHLRVLRELGQFTSFEEKGIFRDYFKFELLRNSQNLPVARATGQRAPVQGMELEFDGTDSDLDALKLAEDQGVKDAAPRTGEKRDRQVRDTLEEAYLAQQIFRGETGRYARSWNELSQIASFGFQARESLSDAQSPVPFGESSSVIDFESLSVSSSTREPAASAPEPPESAGALVIEPIAAELH